MAKFGSSSALFLVDGYDFLASKLASLSFKHTAITETSDGLGDNYESNSPTGKQKATISQGQGYFDTTANSLHDAMASKMGTTPQATKRVACFGCQGQTVGAVFYGFEGLDSVEYEPLISDGKLTKASATHLITGQVNPGMIVQPLATFTADWNTKTLGTVTDYTLDPSQYNIPIASATKASPCVVTTSVPHGLTSGDLILTTGNSLTGPSINSEQAVTVISTTTYSVAVDTSLSTGAGTGGSFVRANSSGGAVGYQQVKACSGFTNFVGKLRDSADDTTYADLITFADNVTAPYAERATVTGVVDRYICYDGNVTGIGSITAFCGVART